MAKKESKAYEPLNPNEIGTGMSPEESMDESKELWDAFEEVAGDKKKVPEPRYRDIAAAVGEEGEFTRRQSSLTTKEHLTGKGVNVSTPLYRIGEKLTHPKHGYGFVIEAIKVGKTNQVSIRFGNDIYDISGTDKEIKELFDKGKDIETGDAFKKKDSVGDVIKQRDEATGQETEVVVKEERGDGTAVVEDKTTGEQKEIDMKTIKEQVASKKVAQVSNIAFEDFWELGAVPGTKSALFNEFSRFVSMNAPYVNVTKALRFNISELKDAHIYDTLSDTYEKWHASKQQADVEPAQDGVPLPVDVGPDSVPVEPDGIVEEPVEELVIPGDEVTEEFPIDELPSDETVDVEEPIEDFPQGEAMLESKKAILKKVGIVIGDTFQMGGHSLEITNIYTLDQFGDVMLKVNYDGSQEVAVPYESFIKEWRTQQEGAVPTASKKEAQPPEEEIDIEKTDETEIEEVDNPLEPEPEAPPLPEEGSPTGSVWQDVLKKVLTEPDVAQKIVKLLIDLAEGQPELMTKIDSILPDGGKWANREWLQKNAGNFYKKLMSAINKEPEKKSG